jgi:hypothetical protein
MYAWILGVVIAAGLFSRSAHAHLLPGFVATYAGDTLWTLAIFLTLGLLFPRGHTLVHGAVCLGVSYLVEISQLYQADWINAVRDTTVGALALGAGFLGSDFVCYTVGGLMGVAGETLFFRRGKAGMGPS